MTTATTAEFPHAMHGVSGRMLPRHSYSWDKERFSAQKWVSERRAVPQGMGYGPDAYMHVEARFDDEHRNGRTTFTIGASIRGPKADAGGCLHKEIEQVFPELASLVKWHLCATDGPMYYASNTIYLAGDRDHWGLRKGEASRSPKHQDTFIRFGSSPITHKLGTRFAEWVKSKPGAFEIVPVEHVDREPRASTYKFQPKFTFKGFVCQWHECPFDTEREAREWQSALASGDYTLSSVPTLFGEGKARELDLARSVAIWPEATDEELSQEPEQLKTALLARLPGLLERFRAAMEGAGFAWSPASLLNTTSENR